MRNIVLLTAGLLLLFTGCSGAGAGAADDTELDASYYTDIHGWNDDKGLDVSFLGRGINLGNFLEAPRDADGDGIKEDDDGEGNWTGERKITQQDIQRIAAAGFASVRVPVKWSDYLEKNDEDTDGTNYELMEIGGYSRLDRVKEVLGWIQAEGMRAVLNVHHYNEMMDVTGTGLSLDQHQDRLNALWNQLSTEFPLSEYPADQLVFELLNEPHGDMGYDDWNTVLARLVETIWTDNAATQVSAGDRRKIMIGTANWGGVPGLYQLNLPAVCNADNTIITVHYYEPFHFTHQGAEWNDGADAWIGTRWLGTEADQADLLDLFADIETWNSGGFEIYVGEFGVYSKYSDPNDQKAWTAFIAREAEERNYSWAYWEYAAGFGAYDPGAGEWREQLITALIPENSP